MKSNYHNTFSNKAAQCGEPSYVWRSGQERRFKMIVAAAGEELHGIVLENGCGVGEYLTHLEPLARQAVGLDYEFERSGEAHKKTAEVVNAAGEFLPFGDNAFNIILSHEVLEHVKDDRRAVEEIIRALRPGGRLILFVPNRGYPFETHGIYWRGEYKFGNKLFINYLPRKWRNRLAPHVRVYDRDDLDKLFTHLPVKIIERKIIFGAYDNIIARQPKLGKLLRRIMVYFEGTPLRFFGLSHFWVVEKTH
jgi:SAM-dependent methyltransferase